ncbi:hypothetical protein ORV05_20855 [Amycolatopsis cynarae]|uniref:TetR family transcriptional regulator n=1 Tax=Amycolatopsis cynarae TaxID=2995223 RepID=A0ABY7AUS8_9PSEU|nr:hypothetical protein [Amycolatopsis sp. HUAS 11-8]WAL63464.1 hypothetical protein ORV05_20855 [Amycolatopsis sp. HUAS 11-8]
MTSASVHIRGTSDDREVRAAAAIQEEAERMALAFEAKVALLADLELDPPVRQAAHAALAAFATGRLRPYLEAADEILYTAAENDERTRLLVRALRAQQESIDRRISELVAATTTARAAHAARAVSTLLQGQIAVMHTVLLPALAGLPGTDLARLAGNLTALLAGGRIPPARYGLG